MTMDDNVSVGERGISPIIGEILMIGIIIVAMGVIASAVLVSPTRERFADMGVRLENTSPTSSDSVKVILKHRGGDALDIPDGPEDEFRVIGFNLENGWENTIAWDNWVFSDPANGFEFAEEAVGILRYDGASIWIGDEVRITVSDLYSDKMLMSEVFQVENSLLY